ncbi:hypothetical protein C2S53_016474 [Perilla frutescens var. hirtella]|uniref:C2H2-type domain-containing protein n=1 Tax=Perilla frutescens var. hirtella TaxID=608512 RepID=A0AAD4JNU3_PERFH|nr:hypothetical protein C2S53_016474 [Perilla frutescens var. hirtella]
MTDESTISSQDPQNGSINPPPKKKRNLPGTPDPEAEVIALSPKTLMATNRFLCEICGKGFQRDQNLQLHRRGHNLPWKLKQRTSKEVRKRVYVCPEKTCVHNHPSRALGDLTGIKKHFCRKHGDKKWKCDKCSKRYAVHSDWKAHSKTCGTREYKSQETARVTAATHVNTTLQHAASNLNYHFLGGMGQHFPSIFKPISNIDPINNIPIPVSFSHELTHSVPKTLQDMHYSTTGLIGPLGLSQDHPFSNPPPSTYHNLNWDNFSNVKYPSINIDMPNNPFTNPKEVSIPSLFSTHQNQSDHGDHQAAARMSATALLQKAAQIGATTTTTTHDPSIILGNFGLKCSGNNSVQDGNKLCGLYTSTSSVTSGLGSDVESSVNDHSAVNHLQMFSSKRRRLLNDHENVEGGETRDFLGVGINPICHPSSLNGWI